MMKVRLLVPRATLDGPQSPGDIIETDDAEAERMIAAGQAEIVRRVAPERATDKRRAEKAVR